MNSKGQLSSLVSVALIPCQPLVRAQRALDDLRTRTPSIRKLRTLLANEVARVTQSYRFANLHIRFASQCIRRAGLADLSAGLRFDLFRDHADAWGLPRIAAKCQEHLDRWRRLRRIDAHQAVYRCRLYHA